MILVFLGLFSFLFLSFYVVSFLFICCHPLWFVRSGLVLGVGSFLLVASLGFLYCFWVGFFVWSLFVWFVFLRFWFSWFSSFFVCLSVLSLIFWDLSRFVFVFFVFFGGFLCLPGLSFYCCLTWSFGFYFRLLFCFVVFVRLPFLFLVVFVPFGVFHCFSWFLVSIRCLGFVLAFWPIWLFLCFGFLSHPFCILIVGYLFFCWVSLICYGVPLVVLSPVYWLLVCRLAFVIYRLSGSGSC